MSIVAAFTQSTSKDAIENRMRFKNSFIWILTYTFVSGVVGSTAFAIGNWMNLDYITRVVLSAVLGLSNLTSYVMSGSFGYFITSAGENYINSKISILNVHPRTRPQS